MTTSSKINPEVLCAASDTVRIAFKKLDKSAEKILFLIDGEKRFQRTVTDGDLRRLLLSGVSLDEPLSTLPDVNSITIQSDYTKREVYQLMKAHSIDRIPVLDISGILIDFIRREDIEEPILLVTPHMGDTERQFVDDAFRTNWIAPIGPNVDAFERELADTVSIDNAAAVSSGTAAIHIALHILDVGPGDIVFCSTLTFIASANPIVYLGAEPVFIDSDEASWNMSVVALECAFRAADSKGKLPKAVIVVNLYGQSADLDPILSLCRRYNVPLVEDAAESLGASYKGVNSGTIGDIGIYSFNGNKIITTSGGGMLVSNNKKYVERARHLSTRAKENTPYYHHTEIGYNYRMSNVLAGIGRGQLKVLGERVKRKREIFDFYRNAFSCYTSIEWMPEPSWSTSTRWLSVALIKDVAKRDVSHIILELSKNLIEARHVWKPLHCQPIFEGCLYFTDGNQSISEKIFENGICLPSSSNMTEKMQEAVCDNIRDLIC